MAEYVAQVYGELCACVRRCTDRGLLHSAKWAASQLAGLPEEEVQAAVTLPLPSGPPEDAEPPHVHSALLLAKTFFDLKEYLRCWNLLCRSDYRSKRALFLKLYALYMAGEKMREEEILELTGTDGARPVATVNPKGEELFAELSELQRDEAGMDAFLYYLYGLVLKDRGQSSDATAAFARAVQQMPCLWSAWSELAALCTDPKEALGAQLPEHWARDFFFALVFSESNQAENSLECYRRLQQLFPNSNYVRSQLAVTHYHLKDFDAAHEEFDEVLETDPYQLETIDTFSNILYVQGKKNELSRLAHRAVTVDKFKPETNCIVGNYYSLKSQHEKAVVYFQRALRLDPRYLSAWTLMGHELVELKNTQAAIDAYRHAVDISPRDYRAWYGLGQTYEILQLYYYALYYYRKAANLRAQDSRMWTAMGGCYENLKRTNDAMRCYQRAQALGDKGIAMAKLADLYQGMQCMPQAAECYSKFVNLHSADEPQESERGPLLFLANYYKEQGRLDEAERCCIRLMNFQGQEKELAKSMLRELHNLRLAQFS